MKGIFGIILTATARFKSMLSTMGGTCCALAVGIFDFLMGYKVAIGVTLIAVLLDMVWGIAAAKVQGKYAKSELMRATATKISGYATVLIMTILLENLIMGGHSVGSIEITDERWAVDVIAAIICSTELWSICGNILIVRPNTPFFKIIRLSLVGEIASKLNIKEEEVKEVFENNGNFKGENKRRKE